MHKRRIALLLVLDCIMTLNSQLLLAEDLGDTSSQDILNMSATTGQIIDIVDTTPSVIDVGNDVPIVVPLDPVIVPPLEIPKVELPVTTEPIISIKTYRYEDKVYNIKDGTPIQNVKIVITNKEDNSIMYQASSDLNGDFSFEVIKMGEYGITLEREGFNKIDTTIVIDKEVSKACEPK